MIWRWRVVSSVTKHGGSRPSVTPRWLPSGKDNHGRRLCASASQELGGKETLPFLRVAQSRGHGTYYKIRVLGTLPAVPKRRRLLAHLDRALDEGVEPPDREFPDSGQCYRNNSKHRQTACRSAGQSLRHGLPLRAQV